MSQTITIDPVTRLEGHGKITIQLNAQGEVEHGHKQLERDAVSYISHNYDLLIESGKMKLLDGDFKAGDAIHVTAKDGELVFAKK